MTPTTSQPQQAQHPSTLNPDKPNRQPEPLLPFSYSHDGRHLRLHVYQMGGTEFSQSCALGLRAINHDPKTQSTPTNYNNLNPPILVLRPAMMGATFGYMFFSAGVPLGEVAEGFLVPRLSRSSLPAVSSGLCLGDMDWSSPGVAWCLCLVKTDRSSPRVA